MMNKGNNSRAFFLDRDGILNKLINNRPPWEISEILIFEHAYEIIKIIKKNNYKPVVVTNQPDEARGNYQINTEKINKIICEELNLDDSYICKHPYDNICNCRKPKPGLLLKASYELNLNISESFILGDREKDIYAGIAAGTKTILLSKDKLCKSDYYIKNHKELLDLLEKIL